MKEKPSFFDHEKLLARYRSIEFVAWFTENLENIAGEFTSSAQAGKSSILTAMV